MEFYTSYFGNLKKISKQLFPKSYIFVSIARKKPSWFTGIEFQYLAPSSNLFFRFKQGEVSKEEFKKEFLEELSFVPFTKIMRELEEISQGKCVIFLCWEKYPDFCHRYLVSKWFIENGIFCEELDLSKIKRN